MHMGCRECRGLLSGYIQRELSPKQRERVSRHLSACSDCYAVYVGQRDVARELAINMPRLGSEHPPLDKIRAAVMVELAQPKTHTGLYQARYSLAALVLMVTLLLPWTFRSYASAPPTQPRPENVTPQGTTVISSAPTEAVTLTATLQSNYAPIVGVTDTP